MKRTTTVFMILMIIVSLSACSNSINDFEYHATTDGVIIDKYIGNSIKVKIPNKIEGEPVIKIAMSAFKDSGISSVNIPNTVTHIGIMAFSGCFGLTEITIPNNVTEIGGGAFENCSGLTEIKIPGNVMYIGKEAFKGCIELTKITIPDSVTHIGESAFSSTKWYNKQPDGLLYTGKVAYGYKGDMPENTSIAIREGTVGIADDAFYSCENLTSVIFPNSMTIIGSSAFYSCYNLNNIILPDGVTTIGREAFNHCYDLTVTYKGNDYQYCEYDLFGWGG